MWFLINLSNHPTTTWATRKATKKPTEAKDELEKINKLEGKEIEWDLFINTELDQLEKSMGKGTRGLKALQDSLRAELSRIKDRTNGLLKKKGLEKSNVSNYVDDMKNATKTIREDILGLEALTK